MKSVAMSRPLLISLSKRVKRPGVSTCHPAHSLPRDTKPIDVFGEAHLCQISWSPDSLERNSNHRSFAFVFYDVVSLTLWEGPLRQGILLCALRSVEGCDATVSFAIVQPKINDGWNRVSMAGGENKTTS